MAGYVKMWTTLRNNTEFLSLSMGQRGMYMQLILACKEQRDDGTVCYRNVTALGTACGCERKTAGKTLAILTEKSLCTYTKNDHGVLIIEIPNYNHWQQLTVDQVREKSRKKTAKIPSLRPDQTIPDQTTPITADKPPDSVDDSVSDFVEKYRQICQQRGLKKVLIVNNSRRGKIRQRLKELAQAGVTVEEYMQKISKSPFLRGDRGNWTGADFDFIIGAQNIGKILDGKYDRRDSDIDWGNIGGDDEKE